MSVGVGGASPCGGGEGPGDGLGDTVKSAGGASAMSTSSVSSDMDNCATGFPEAVSVKAQISKGVCRLGQYGLKTVVY